MLEIIAHINFLIYISQRKLRSKSQTRFCRTIVALTVFMSRISLRSTFVMEHPLVNIAGILIIRNLPKVLVVVAVYIVMKRALMETLL